MPHITSQKLNDLCDERHHFRILQKNLHTIPTNTVTIKIIVAHYNDDDADDDNVDNTIARLQHGGG